MSCHVELSRRSALHLVAGAVSAASGAAAQALPPAKLVLGTATPGGGFPVYGSAFVDALREVDGELTIEPRNTRGSTENIPLLEAGQLDIGLVQGEPAYAALAGDGRPASPLKVVTAMYATPGLFVVRADSPVRVIADLRGRPVALGAKGSGLTIMGRMFLRGAGLDPERDIQPITLDRAGDGPAMVQDGRAAALFGGGAGWPGFAALADGPGGARFVAPTPEESARILAEAPSMRSALLPAGSYRGQEAAIASVGSWSLVLARPDLDEATGYRLAKALDAARAGLARRLAQASGTDPTNTVAAVRAAWLHPGVARYLRDAGYLAR